MDGERGEPSHKAAHDQDAVSVAVAGDEPDASTDPSVPATTLSAAFDELRNLFPGRVLEVTNPVEEASSSVDDQLSPLDDEVVGHDGYDDDDQDRLSFGPSRDV